MPTKCTQCIFLLSVTQAVFSNLVCPPLAAPILETYSAGQFAAVEQGGSLVNFLRMFRKSGPEFMQSEVHLVKINQCQLKPTHTLRFVNSSSPLAAKTSSGQCIVTTTRPTSADCNMKPSTTLQCCEIKETCFWKPPVQAQPRLRKYTNAQAIEASNWRKAYLKDIAKKGGLPGIIGAVLVFLGAPVYGLFQLCGYCQMPDRAAFTKTQKLLPLGFFLFFWLGIILCGFFAYFGNQKSIKGIAVLFADVKLFLTSMGRFVYGTLVPLNMMLTHLTKAQHQLNSTVVSSKWVSTADTSLTLMLNTWANQSASASQKAAGFDFLSQVNNVDQTITTNVHPMVTSFGSVLNTLETSLVSGEKALLTHLTQATGLLSTVKTMVVTLASSASNSDGTLSKFSLIRNYGSSVVFALSILFGALGLLIMLIAVVCPCGAKCHVRWTKSLNVSWVLNWLITIVAFILAAFCFCLAIVWADVCVLMNLASSDFTILLGTVVGRTLNSCFTNTPLVQTFGLANSFSFTDTLLSNSAQASTYNVTKAFHPVISQLQSIDQQLESKFDFTAMYQNLTAYTNVKSNSFKFVEDIHAYDLQHGGGCNFSESYLSDRTVYEPWLANTHKSNSSYGQTFRRIDQESSIAYMTRLYNQSAHCPKLSSTIVSYYQMVYSLLSTSANLGYNTQLCAEIGCPAANWPYSRSMKQQINTLVADLATVQTDIKNITGVLAKGVIADVNIFYCNSRCGFVKSYYDAFYDSLCTTTLEGFGQISLAMYLLALFQIPIMITTCSLTRRLRSLDFGKVALIAADDQGVEDNNK